MGKRLEGGGSCRKGHQDQGFVEGEGGLMCA